MNGTPQSRSDRALTETVRVFLVTPSIAVSLAFIISLFLGLEKLGIGLRLCLLSVFVVFPSAMLAFSRRKSAPLVWKILCAFAIGGVLGAGYVAGFHVWVNRLTGLEPLCLREVWRPLVLFALGGGAVQALLAWLHHMLERRGDEDERMSRAWPAWVMTCVNATAAAAVVNLIFLWFDSLLVGILHSIEGP